MSNLFNPAKTITLNLVGLDGNAFSLMGAFRRQAKREGWSKEDIEKVIEKCTSGNYDNLLFTLQCHCTPDYEDEEDDAEVENTWHKLIKDENGKTIGYQTYVADRLISETFYK